MSERKALSLSLPDDAAPGAVQAVFSTFDILDKGRDIVKRSAFADLDGAEVPLVWSHEWGSMGIGKGVIRVQAKQAVFDGAFHLQHDLSRDAYATVKAMGGLQEYSYGFQVSPDGERWSDDADGPIRTITKIARVFEVSPVLVGMGEGTHTLAIKGLFEELVDAKAGRRLSAASLARIQAAIEALGALLEADAAVDDGKAAAPPEPCPPPPPPAPDPTPTLAAEGERLVAALHAYAVRVQASPDPEIRAAKDWVLSATRRLAETRRTLDDRLRLAEEAGDLSALELEQQFRALDARIGLVIGGGTACRR